MLTEQNRQVLPRVGPGFAQCLQLLESAAWARHQELPGEKGGDVEFVAQDELFEGCIMNGIDFQEQS